MTMARDQNPFDLMLAGMAKHQASDAGVAEMRRGQGGFAIHDPMGELIHIPAADDEDYSYFSLRDAAAIRQYYDENGYVVVRGLVPGGLCDRALTEFEREVKPYPGHIYRQTTANPERHAFTDWGLMLNPILNVQSLDTRSFSQFKEAGLAILTHSRTQEAVRTILGEPGKIVQSMYFDGNPATWPHQDTYYLDAEELGRMTAAWFAVVDIAPGAGRFFIYPKSHRIDMAKNGGNFDIAFNHAQYKKLVVDVIHNHRLECRAPALRQGDVLFWSAKTIHGSLETTQPRFARSSFTAHYIPSSARFLQYQTRIRRLNCVTVNGMEVHRPKDLARQSQRSIFWIETHYPRTFQTVKKLAIKAVTR
jgi:phytanoyl-CoA hydroxylase